jgi:hypothetical protein
MHVIGHQHIGVHGAAMLRGGFGEPAVTMPVVVDGEERRHAVVTALDDVQRLTRQEIATGSRCRNAPRKGGDGR